MHGCEKWIVVSCTYFAFYKDPVLPGVAFISTECRFPSRRLQELARNASTRYQHEPYNKYANFAKSA